MKKIFSLLALALLVSVANAQDFKLTESGYFRNEGVDVMSFSDFYPEGHQGGVSIIMNGQRIATNGDLRFDPTPGQWQPVPKQISREIVGESIVTNLCYPDSSRHLTGFNPMVYPDLVLNYTVTLKAEGRGFRVIVDLDKPVPEEYLGKVGFNLELFPGVLFGKPWIMDSQTGIYPPHPNGPMETAKSYIEHIGDFHLAGHSKANVDQFNRMEGYSPLIADDIVAAPYAEGISFTSQPDDPYSRFTVKTLTSPLKLYDGRLNHNNGWFVLRSEIPAGVTKGAVEWIIEPNVVEGFRTPAVVQTSQVGYHPLQEKVAVIETDPRTAPLKEAQVYVIKADGEHLAATVDVVPWEKSFLRYKYYKADFSSITEEGLYQVRYGDARSSVIRIAKDIYDRGVWQPVVEYFLPVQMCHMEVREKYRLWHDLCHMDDAAVAPVGNHFDGYDQTFALAGHEPYEHIEGLNVGGWHDAADFDMRIESQTNECYVLTMAYECFHPQIDVTSINQKTLKTEIHESDGKNDIQQQIEHGALSVVNTYLALGRLYRGIICNSLRQYVLLGEAKSMTDGIPGTEDDRWVFTEDNPSRELGAAAGLAASARALRGYNDTLANHCHGIAAEIFANTAEKGVEIQKIRAATELYLTTEKVEYLDYILSKQKTIIDNIDATAWFLARIEKQLEPQKKYRKFCTQFREALTKTKAVLDEQIAETPYGVPYRPYIWGAGWDIQSFGYQYYFLVDAFPDIFDESPIHNALHFVLGRHPGSNQASFASGVGAKSVTIADCMNRANWSYIPGGVVSGTSLIRPDFPEMLPFPFLWQQVEYCLGGASSHYMFLVLASQHLINSKQVSK